MTRLLAATLIASSLLAGCSLGERFGSAEDRINRVVPPALALRNATEQLASVPETAPGDNAALEAQRKARLKLRALNCARDYTPRWLDSDDSLRERLTDKACFAAADAEIARWLNLVRAGRLLAQGPLRPPPAQQPPMIASQEFIATLVFAERAGVAMIGSTNRLGTVDLATGAEIWHEDRGNGPGPLQLSANGRLFRGHAGGTFVLRAADSGETLVDFGPGRSFAFVDARHLVVFDTQKGGAELLELASGRQAPISGLRPGLSGGLAVPLPGAAGAPDRFALLQPMQAYLVEIARAEGQLQARLIAEQTGGPGWGSPHLMTLTPDGQTVVDGSQAMSFLNLKDLSLAKVALEPMRPVLALPTANPDEFLVGAYAGDGGGALRHFIFARAANTLAAIEPADVTGGRFVWIPTLKSLAQVNDRRITPVATPKAGPVKAIGDVIAEVLDEANRRKLERFEAATNPGASAAAGGPATPHVPDAPMAALAADAQIEGVGVYQGTGPTSRPGQPRAAGQVEVRVRRSAKPIVLVLSSYEPVRWIVLPESGARIATVLVSGYHPSTVVGAGSARVVQIGQDYAYNREGDNYPRLQRAVARTVGRPMAMFQGRYEGASFSVGGP